MFPAKSPKSIDSTSKTSPNRSKLKEALAKSSRFKGIVIKLSNRSRPSLISHPLYPEDSVSWLSGSIISDLLDYPLQEC